MKLVLQPSRFKPLGLYGRSIFNRELGRYRYDSPAWKVVTSKRKTKLENIQQFANAMGGLIDAQHTHLVAMENKNEGKDLKEIAFNKETTNHAVMDDDEDDPLVRR
ncbi:MAG: hypothetical protein EZS28_019900 [Streblomastix strix]|uniref:Uncharacterized protein n=1 Tax=Streblomastix strix TaxID=222440 RepID=A0A5J4VQK6_9EUKA|nr:MAG: hypothetical protein EZS28_019900 [Streblomastix strix]